VNALLIYTAAVASGNVAFFLCDGARLFWNENRMRYDWPDPVDAPLMLAFLLSPLPGLVAIVDFLMAVRERLRHYTLCADKPRYPSGRHWCIPCARWHEE